MNYEQNPRPIKLGCGHWILLGCAGMFAFVLIQGALDGMVDAWESTPLLLQILMIIGFWGVIFAFKNGGTDS